MENKVMAARCVYFMVTYSNFEMGTVLVGLTRKTVIRLPDVPR